MGLIRRLSCLLHGHRWPTHRGYMPPGVPGPRDWREVCERCGLERPWPSTEGHHRESYAVLCRQADGEQIAVTLEASSAQDAAEQVRAHVCLFYGGGDTAGRWLAQSNPSTIVEVGEARPLSTEWS